MKTITLNSYTSTGITLSGFGDFYITVTSAGTINAGGHFGIDGGDDTLSVLNQGMISGSQAGISLPGGGTINNSGTAAVIHGAEDGIYSAKDMINHEDYAFAPGVVSNTGTISGGGRDGVYLGGSGTVTNTGSAALVLGRYNGVYGFGPRTTIINSGTIIGTERVGVDLKANAFGVVDNTASAAFIYGGSYGVGFTSYPGTLINAGTIRTGPGGIAGVAMFQGGTLSNMGATSVIYGHGYGLIDQNSAGIVTNAGTIKAVSQDGIYMGAGGDTITNSGTIAGRTAAILIEGTGSDRVVAQGRAAFIGTVTAAGTGNTLEFSGTGRTLASIGTQFTGFQTIAFDPGSAWTISGTTLALETLSITGFSPGDVIDLKNFAASTETFVSNALTLSNGTTREILDITVPYASPGFILHFDNAGGTLIDVTCFCSGTHILTPDGETLVENLKPGDLVITAGAKIRPVIWAGREEINIVRHPEPELVRPIRITAGALGHGIPERDLRLSPHHAVLVDGALVEAISLVNQRTIFQEQATRQVTYHHLELESHDILLAEGCPCESYLDTGTRLQAA